jgi:hypothetical protein
MDKMNLPRVPVPRAFLFSTSLDVASCDTNPVSVTSLSEDMATRRQPSGSPTRTEGPGPWEREAHKATDVQPMTLAGCSTTFLLRKASSEDRMQSLHLHISQLRAALEELLSRHQHLAKQVCAGLLFRDESDHRQHQGVLRPLRYPTQDEHPCDAGK